MIPPPKKNFFLFFAAAASAAAAGLWATPARAFEVHLAPDGLPQRWRFVEATPLTLLLVDPPAGLRLAPRSDLRQAMTFAGLAWQAVESAHVPVRYGGQLHARGAQNGEVLVQFDTGTSFPAGRDAAGFTDLALDGHDILSARIHLNAVDFDWDTTGGTTALDVQSIVEHELGHALGLAHPCGDTDTQTPSCSALPSGVYQLLTEDVMFPSIQPGPRRLLAQDDRDGVTSLEPAAAPPEIAPEIQALQPTCLEETQQIGPGLARNVTVVVGRAPDPVVLELLAQDQLVAQAPLGRDAKGSLIALVPAGALRALQPLDARLVGRSGKAGVLFGALDVAASCGKHGCSQGGATAFAFLPLVFFALRRRKAVLLLLLCSAPAFAYKRSVNTGGVTVWWSPRGHPYQIDAQGTPDVPGTAAFTAIRKSLLTWASVGCSDLAFPDQGLSQNPKDRVVGYFPGQFNRNLILFRTRRCGNGQNGGVVPAGDACITQGGCANLYDCWDHGDGVIATTTTTSNRFTGQINDSDIEINDAVGSDGTKFTFTAVDGPPCSDPNQTGCVRIDIQNTITHESGHTVGLDHTPDPNATMYATAPEGEVSKRVLGSDDIAGICDIYPRGKETVTGNIDPITLTLSKGGGGCGCSQAQTGPGAALCLAALLFQMSRRSRRRPQLEIRASKANPSHALR